MKGQFQKHNTVNTAVQKNEHSHGGAVQFVDNRSEKLSPEKFQEMANSQYSSESNILQMKQITSGWGKRKTILWDTDWKVSEKKAKIKELDYKQLMTIIESLQAEGDTYSEDILLLQEAVHSTIPEPDMGSPSQKKTPEGGTRIINMNYKTNPGGKRNDREFGHFLFFLESAFKLGLHLNILTTEAGQADIMETLKNPKYKGLSYTITLSKLAVSEWAEDSTEFLQSGKLSVLHDFDDGALDKGMSKGRRDRWRGMVPKEFAEAPHGRHTENEWVPKGILVNAGTTGKTREEDAKGKDQDVGHIRTYIEGGNMLTGEDVEGNTIVLIGKDALAATAYAYQIGPDAIRKIIQEDFGLESPYHVIFVEQPGKFHLDMGMLFIGHGIVIVNDSREQLREAVDRLKEMDFPATRKTAAKLQLTVNLENQAARDLMASGIKVIRRKLERGSYHNFFNGEFVLGHDGKTYYLTNGGPEEEQAKFKSLMVEELKVVADVLFTPKAVAQASLREQGGVGCRIKGSPCLIDSPSSTTSKSKAKVPESKSRAPKVGWYQQVINSESRWRQFLRNLSPAYPHRTGGVLGVMDVLIKMIIDGGYEEHGNFWTAYHAFVEANGQYRYRLSPVDVIRMRTNANPNSLKIMSDQDWETYREFKREHEEFEYSH